MTQIQLKITGLDCMDCAHDLESSVAKQPRVEDAELRFFDGTLTVHGDVDEQDLRKLISKMGYGVEDEDSQTLAPAAEPNALVGFWRYLLQQLETQLALIAAGVIFISFVTQWLGAPGWVAIALQIAALIMAGYPIARSGVVNLWVNRTFNINFLMTVAGLGAVVIGEYAEAALLIMLFDIA